MKTGRKLYIITALMCALVMLVSCAPKVSEEDARALVTSCMDDMISGNTQTLSKYFTADSDISEFADMDIEKQIAEGIQSAAGMDSAKEIIGEENFNELMDSMVPAVIDSLSEILNYEITGCEAVKGGVDVNVEVKYPSPDEDMDLDISAEDAGQYIMDAIGISSPEELITELAKRKGVTLYEIAAEYASNPEAAAADILTCFKTEMNEVITKVMTEILNKIKESPDAFETETLKLRVVSDNGELKIDASQSEL